MIDKDKYKFSIRTEEIKKDKKNHYYRIWVPGISPSLHIYVNSKEVFFKNNDGGGWNKHDFNDLKEYIKGLRRLADEIERVATQINPNMQIQDITQEELRVLMGKACSINIAKDCTYPHVIHFYDLFFIQNKEDKYEYTGIDPVVLDKDRTRKAKPVDVSDIVEFFLSNAEEEFFDRELFRIKGQLYSLHYCEESEDKEGVYNGTYVLITPGHRLQYEDWTEWIESIAKHGKPSWVKEAIDTLTDDEIRDRET